MAMRPGPRDTGIVFRRTDLAGRGVSIPADWRNVADMPHVHRAANPTASRSPPSSISWRRWPAAASTIC